MNHKIAIFDLDDTVCDLVSDALILLNSLSKRTLKVADWYVYDVPTLYNITNLTYFHAAIAEKLLETVKPVPYALETVHALNSAGYSIHYVTARAWHTDAYNVTKEWLRFNRFPLFKHYDEDCLHIVPLFSSKAKYVAENIAPSVDIAIDNSAHHIREYKEQGVARFPFLIDQPWNQTDTDLNLHRIGHISHVLNYNKHH